eukprot:GHVO01000016.1.p1 GENE.GHVO01000016.1~~GHVO01000016.1.p1  ORF type:complete len:589 (+),score=43.73 GHVO01000016.1:1002-2768(+)
MSFERPSGHGTLMKKMAAPKLGIPMKSKVRSSSSRWRAGAAKSCKGFEKQPAVTKLLTNEILELIPVTCVEDFRNPPFVAKPLFTHHFFGPREYITGWSEDTRIQVFFTTDTFDVFVNVTGSPLANSTDMSSPVVSTGKKRPGRKRMLYRNAAELIGALTKESVRFPGGFCPSAEAFEKLLTSERPRFEPYGELINEFPYSVAVVGKGQTLDEYAAVEIRVSDFQKPEFCDYHRRVEWFLHFFIENLSNIPQASDWKVVMAYIRYSSALVFPSIVPPSEPSAPACASILQQRRSSVEKRLDKSLSPDSEASHSTSASSSQERGGKLPGVRCSSRLRRRSITYTLGGVVTICHRKEKENNLMTISQVLVFPHAQKAGLGTAMLNHIFRAGALNPNVDEIDVESPAPSFLRLESVTCVSTCIEEGIFDRNALYPITKDEVPKFSVLNDGFLQWAHLPSRISLRLLTKFSPLQIARMSELLTLARLLPHTIEIKSQPRPDSDRTIRTNDPTSRSCRTVNVEEGISKTPFSGPIYRCLHECAIKRLQKEYLDDQSSLSPEEIIRRIESHWKSLMYSYCSSLKKLRQMYPPKA